MTERTARWCTHRAKRREALGVPASSDDSGKWLELAPGGLAGVGRVLQCVGQGTWGWQIDR